MYEEHNSDFALKDMILKLLVIVLLAFLIVWLFPTKGYMDNAINEKLGTSKTQIFNTNINVMRQAATNYFTGSRLPKDGKTKKITLEKMLDKKLLVEFTDSKGKTCNTKESYVEITKNNDEYKMKVNLVCSDKKAYVISYLGDNNSCADGVCSKKKLADETANEVKNDIVKNEETAKDVANQNVQTNKVTSSKTVNCQYVKYTNGYYTNYGGWSNWITNAVSGSNTRAVQTKVERQKTGTTRVQMGYQTVADTPIKVTRTSGAVVYKCTDEYTNAGLYMQPTYCIKVVPRYVQKDVYSNVTYYRYRDRSYVNGTANYKWGTCNSKDLLNQGYKKTGKTR